MNKSLHCLCLQSVKIPALFSVPHLVFRSVCTHMDPLVPPPARPGPDPADLFPLRCMVRSSEFPQGLITTPAPEPERIVCRLLTPRLFFMASHFSSCTPTTKPITSKPILLIALHTIAIAFLSGHVALPILITRGERERKEE